MRSAAAICSMLLASIGLAVGSVCDGISLQVGFGELVAMSDAVVVGVVARTVRFDASVPQRESILAVDHILAGIDARDSVAVAWNANSWREPGLVCFSPDGEPQLSEFPDRRGVWFLRRARDDWRVTAAPLWLDELDDGSIRKSIESLDEVLEQWTENSPRRVDRRRLLLATRNYLELIGGRSNRGLQLPSPLSRRLEQAARQPFGTGLAAEPLGS